jgi:hypothetical protein
MLAPPDPNAVAYPDFVYARTPATSSLLPSLLSWLRSSSDIEWDVLSLPKMLSDPEAGAPPAVSDPRFFRHSRGVCYYFKCDEGIAAIQARISSGLRKHMRWCRRQLNGMGKMEVVSSRDPAELPHLFEEFLELEASGWKSKGGTAIRQHPDVVQFYSRLMSRFSAARACEINLQRLGGRNIAGQFCLISGGTWYHLKIAYDEEFHRFSPGFLLFEDLDETIHTANFLTGAEWGDRWHPLQLEVSRVIAPNHTLPGIITLRELKARRFMRTRVIPLVRSLRKRPE